MDQVFGGRSGSIDALGKPRHLGIRHCVNTVHPANLFIFGMVTAFLQLYFFPRYGHSEHTVGEHEVSMRIADLGSPSSPIVRNGAIVELVKYGLD